VAPTGDEEAQLPRYRTALPDRIDVSRGLPSTDGVRSALAVFALSGDDGLDRVAVLAGDGTSHELVGARDRLGRVTDEEGNVLSPLLDASVSPSGTRIFFLQRDTLQVYDLAAAAWTEIDIPEYAGEQARWQTPDGEIWVPDELGSTSGHRYDLTDGEVVPETFAEPHFVDDGYGPLVRGATSVAQSAHLDDLTVDGVQGVEAIVTETEAAGTSLLTFAHGTQVQKQCCPAIGWVTPDVLLFQSRRSDVLRVLAWRTGTDEVGLVSEVTGLRWGQEWYTSSWAGLATS